MNFEQLTRTCEQAHYYLQGTAISVVNQSLTIRNWLFGHHIVVYEQNGDDRAKYGAELLHKLPKSLSSVNIRGLSDRSLRNCRQLYLVYPEMSQILADLELPDIIWQSTTAKSEKVPEKTGFKGVDPRLIISKLSFTHIIELTREEDYVKRSFYTIQAIQGNWSVKELQRQISSLLYERTGFSKNKEGLILDINKNIERVKPEMMLRDPYVFEFVGLKQEEKFTESSLEKTLLLLNMLLAHWIIICL